MDLINFVGLAAVLSALGMYGIATWVRHSKTTEAVQAVANLATLSAEYYNASDATQPTGAAPDSVHAMRHFPPSSRAPTPAATRRRSSRASRCRAARRGGCAGC